MSVKLMTAVWDNKTGNLDAYETAYLIKLADYGPQVFPSTATLSKRTRISQEKIRRLNISLEQKGYLTIIRRMRKNGSYASNEYRLNANKLLIEAGMEPLDQDEIETPIPPPAEGTPPPAEGTPPPAEGSYNQVLKQVLKQGSSTDPELEKELVEVGFTEASAKVLIHCHGVDKIREGVNATHRESVLNPRGFLNTWLASRRGVTVSAANQQHNLNVEHRRLEEALRKSEQFFCGVAV